MAKKKTRIQMARARGLRYLGQNGAHLSGVPARDLSPAEVAQLNVKQLDACIGSGLYVYEENES